LVIPLRWQNLVRKKIKIYLKGPINPWATSPPIEFIQKTPKNTTDALI